MFKSVVVFAVFLVVIVLATPLDSKAIHLEEVMPLEDGCVRQGGICMRREECNPNDMVFLTDVLCPKQSHRGVVCCYFQ